MRRRIIVRLAGLALLAACGPRPASPTDPLPIVAGTTPAATAAPAAGAAPEPEPPPAPESEPGGESDQAALWPPPTEECELGDPGPAADEAGRLAAACAGREPCTVEWRCRAGHDPAGRPLAVLRLAVPAAPELEFECHPFEYWLLRGDGGAAAPPDFLLRVCNDGYGASGVGEDTIVVRDNRFVHSVYGGSAWRWGGTRELRLVPRELLAESSGGWWNVASNTEEHTWSWETLSGAHAWYSPTCTADGEPPWEEQHEPYRATYVPVFELDAAFVRDGWRDTALDDCGARIAADGTGGFLLDGTAGAPGDAALTVVAAPGPVLFVEVQDDDLRDDADGDRIELWLIDQSFTADYMAHCLPAGTIPDAKRWVFAVSDGRRLEGERRGSPRVQTVQGGEAGARWARVRLELPAATAALAVAFSDVDAAGTAERTLSTVALDRDDPGPLGPFYPIPFERAGCAVEGGRLVTYRKPPDEPVTP